MTPDYNNDRRSNLHERLDRIEDYIKDAKVLRKNLTDSLNALSTRVESIDHTIFGRGKEVGMFSKVERIAELVDTATKAIVRIFWIVAAYLVVATVPAVSSFLYSITHVPKVGG